MRKPATVIVLHRLVHDDEELMSRARRIAARARVVIEERESVSGQTEEGLTAEAMIPDRRRDLSLYRNKRLA